MELIDIVKEYVKSHANQDNRKIDHYFDLMCVEVEEIVGKQQFDDCVQSALFGPHDDTDVALIWANNRIETLEKQLEVLAGQYADLSSKNIDEKHEVAHLRDLRASVTEALTPSAETKAAYFGSGELGTVPWGLIKDVMTLIRMRIHE